MGHGRSPKRTGYHALIAASLRFLPRIALTPCRMSMARAAASPPTLSDRSPEESPRFASDSSMRPASSSFSALRARDLAPVNTTLRFSHQGRVGEPAVTGHKDRHADISADRREDAEPPGRRGLAEDQSATGRGSAWSPIVSCSTSPRNWSGLFPGCWPRTAARSGRGREPAGWAAISRPCSGWRGSGTRAISRGWAGVSGCRNVHRVPVPGRGH